MAYKDILPTTNLTVSDVRDTLGESTNDIGRLCKSTKINKWAKYKPVEGEWPHGGTGWFDVYGYSIPMTIDWIGDNVTEVTKQWIYKPATTKFRLGDFREYMHSSVVPNLVSFPAVADRSKIFSIPDLGITGGVGYASIFDKLKASQPATSPCLGCYMFNKTNPGQYFITATTIGLDLAFPMTQTPFLTGTVIGVVVFLCDQEIPLISSPTRPNNAPRYLSARPFSDVTYKEYTVSGPALIIAGLQPQSLGATVDYDGNMILSTVNIFVDSRTSGGFVGGSYSVTIFIDDYQVGILSGTITANSQVVQTYTVGYPGPYPIDNPNDIRVWLQGSNNILKMEKHFKVFNGNIVAL